MTPRLPLLAAALLASPPALAQLPGRLVVEGDAAGDYFGWSIAPMGDVDGDGVPDLAIGAHQNLDGGHSPDPGYVRLVSGATGATIDTLQGDGTSWYDGPDDHFGQAVAALGDLDGDGVSELLVGAYKDDNVTLNTGMIRVFSGATRALLHQDDGEWGGDRMGISVAALGDVSGDGVPDYAMGVYKDDNLAYNGGAARVHSGADHSQLFVIDGPTVGAAMGWSCAGAGDVDADGVPDVIAGAVQDGTNGTDAGAAWVVSGATGAPLHVLHGDAAGDFFGHAVDGAGDVDGDGHADVIVGAIQSSLAGDATGPGYARVFSGATGAVLFEVVGEAPLDQLGYCVRGAGDLDQDGHADVLIGAPRAVTTGFVQTGLPGYVRLVSGLDGAVLHTFVGDEADDQFGVEAQVVGDLDGDGLPELAFGAPENDADQTRPGYVKVVSGKLLLAERHCVAAPNSAGSGALLTHSGTFSVGEDDLVLRVDGATTNHFGLFFHGASPVQVPFGDGYRCVGGGTRRLGVVATGADGRAELALDLTILAGTDAALLPGDVRSFQFWYRDVPAQASGFNLSDAIRATFHP